MANLDVFNIRASFFAVFVTALAAVTARIKIEQDPIFAVNHPGYASRSTPYSSTILSQSDEKGLDVTSSSTAKKLDSDSSTSSNFENSNRFATQTSSKPYRLEPSYTPMLDERLPDELKDLVGEYQDANFFVLDQLIKYGGFHKQMTEVASEWDIVPTLHVSKLYYKDREGALHSMIIQREQFEDHCGMRIDLPYILGSQYLKLLLSIIQPRTDGLAEEEVDNALCQTFDKLLVAIAGRAIVYDWHVALPAADKHCNDNDKHGSFLAALRRQWNDISYVLRHQPNVLLVRG